MNTRHLMLLSVLLVGCPDEARFEPMITPDAAVDAAIGEQLDTGPIVPNDAQSMDAEDMGLSTDGAAPDANADPMDAGLSTDGTVTDAEVSPTSCTVRFTVILPEGTAESDEVFIAGTFCQNECGGAAGDCCNWIPNDTQWPETVSPRTDNTTVFEMELTPDVDYEYKYTLGAWSEEELREDCQPIANRQIRPDCPNGDTYEVQDVIDAWKGRCN